MPGSWLVIEALAAYLSWLVVIWVIMVWYGISVEIMCII